MLYPTVCLQISFEKKKNRNCTKFTILYYITFPPFFPEMDHVSRMDSVLPVGKKTKTINRWKKIKRKNFDAWYDQFCAPSPQIPNGFETWHLSNPFCILLQDYRDTLGAFKPIKPIKDECIDRQVTTYSVPVLAKLWAVKFACKPIPFKFQSTYRETYTIKKQSN